MDLRINNIYRFEQFKLYVQDRILERDGHSISLPPKEFAALVYLVENPKRLLIKDELMTAVWGETSVEEGNLPRIISSLRKLLGDEDGRLIETRHGYGYYFTATVTDLTSVPDRDCPWVGLVPYDESDARHFCAREHDVQRIVAKLKATSFLALVGSSGSGKSSLMRAGLIPALAHGILPESREWTFLVLRPGANPLRELAKRIRGLVSGQVGEQVDAIVDRLTASPDALSRYVAETRGTQRVIFFVDQFEELVTTCQNDQERDSFIANLQQAAADSSQRYSVIVAIRTSFLPAFETFPSLWQLITEHQYAVLPLDKSKLQQVIEEASRRVGLVLEPGLATEIIADLGEEPGALPLLSCAMRELFKQREGRRLTYRGYQTIGRIREVISSRADDVLSRSPSDIESIRRLMLRLINVGVSPEQDVRRRVLARELSSRGEDAEVIQAVITKLADERLLTIGLMDEETTVELAHEALIRHWRGLSGWINESRQALRAFDVLDAGVKEWQKANRDTDILFRGTKLASAVEMRPLLAEFMTDSHLQFLNASQALAASHDRRRRIVRVIAWSLGVVMLLLIGAWWKWREAAQQRDLATGLRLAAESLAPQQYDPELSLLLAIEAGKAAVHDQVKEALQSAVGALYVRRVLQGHQAQVLMVNGDRSGDRLVTASFDKTARIWNAATGQTVAVLNHSDLVTSAEFSPDGRNVVTSSTDGKVYVWDVGSGRLSRQLIGHDDRVNNASFSTDGTMIVSAGGDETARVWDVATGREVRRLDGHGSWLNSAAFSPDKAWIATASYDNTVRVWSASSGITLHVLRHSASVLNVSFSADGKSLATASADRTAQVWNTSTWRRTCELLGHTGNVNSAVFSPDGRRLVTSSSDGTARIWDNDTCQYVREFRGHRGSVNHAVFGSDNNTILTASGDHTVRVWSLRSIEPRNFVGHQSAVWGVSFNPDGKLALTASADSTARIWDVATGKEIQRIQHAAAVQSAVFSPDGRSLATASADGKGRIWDRSGTLKHELIGHSDMIHAIAFDPTGGRVVTASRDKLVRVWRLETQRPELELRGHTNEATDATFSPDGRWIASASRDNTIRIWSATTGEIAYQFNVGTGWVNSVRYSPDGKFLIGACADKTVRIWSLADRKPVALVRGHDKWVNYAESNSDGTLLASASGDRSARIWHLSSGRQILHLLGRQSSLTSATFSPDSRAIITTAMNGEVMLYTCEICRGSVSELVRIAESRKTREFTAEEQARFLGRPRK